MSITKNYTWHKIANDLGEIEFLENGLAAIAIAGKLICLAKVEGTLLACSAKCPHAGGIMTNGYVDALGNIVCPLHRYKFSLINGRNTSGEGYFLKTYPIEIRANGIFIGFEETSFFNWLK